MKYYFPKKYNSSWWVCYGSDTSFKYIYAHCWDGLDVKVVQAVCDKKNKEMQKWIDRQHH